MKERSGCLNVVKWWRNIVFKDVELCNFFVE